MRITFSTLLFVLLLPYSLRAQPGPPETGNCPNGGYDLNPIDPARADLRLTYTAEGTEDVPSSSGRCMQVLTTLDHVQVLYVLDAHGQWILWSPELHGTLEPEDLEDGLGTRTLRWDRAELEVASRGYGDLFKTAYWNPMNERGWTDLAMRVETSEGPMLALVHVRTNGAEGLGNVDRIAVVREGEMLKR